jgi:hypothetical protein
MIDYGIYNIQYLLLKRISHQIFYGKRLFLGEFLFHEWNIFFKVKNAIYRGDLVKKWLIFCGI